jgi:hypothetical protein
MVSYLQADMAKLAMREGDEAGFRLWLRRAQETNQALGSDRGLADNALAQCWFDVFEGQYAKAVDTAKNAMALCEPIDYRTVASESALLAAVALRKGGHEGVDELVLLSLGLDASLNHRFNDWERSVLDMPLEDLTKIRPVETSIAELIAALNALTKPAP